MIKLGESLDEKEDVALRTVWPIELDFSRWLARNIEILNDQLLWQIDPDSVTQEVSR